MSETAHHADIVLPGSLQEEDEGTTTQIEGRVIKINKAVDCPGDARQDWRIIQDIAKSLGRQRGFTFGSPREIFNELREASRGGIADYSGITCEKIEKQYGVFWPRTSENDSGTPRLFEPGSWNPIAKGAGPFYFSDGKARFNVAAYAPPAEDVDDEYRSSLLRAVSLATIFWGRRLAESASCSIRIRSLASRFHPRLGRSSASAMAKWRPLSLGEAR